MSLLPVGFGGSVAAYDIAKSVRFRASASAYLSRTPAAAGNRKTFTFSAWVKRGQLDGGRMSGVFQGYIDTNNTWRIDFNGSDSLLVGNTVSGVSTVVTTSAVFRDPSAHFHLVVLVDTTQATAANRTVVYVNGVIQSVTGSYVAQNTDLLVNYGIAHYIGNDATAASRTLDGYLSEINFVDGQALDATSFGQFDANGVWQPKKYAGTYGTNGFYLPFSDGTSLTTLCADASGNGNNFTASGVSLTAGATYDWMDDTPTNNFAVLNLLSKNSHTHYDGNLRASLASTTDPRFVKGSIFVSSGKWVAEHTPINTAAGSSRCGAVTESASTSSGVVSGTSVIYYGNGSIYLNGVLYGSYSSYTAGNVIRIELDLDSLTCSFYKDGVFVVTVNGLTSGAYTLGGAASGVSDSFAFNFGQQPWQGGTPSTGFKALSTKNRPTGGSITTSGTFTGNASTDGPFVWLNGNPSTMTINGNAVTFGTHADKTAGGFKVRSSSASYNTAGSNTYSVTVTGKLFGDSSRAPNTAQGNP